MSDEPLFSESEASEIVKRAVELNEESSSDYQAGVTRSELEQIAKEVGVDPTCLRRAIDEHLGGRPQKRESLKFVNEFERVVDGELAADDFDIIIAELPTRASSAPPSQVGRTLNAKVMNGLVMSDVSVTARNGRTRVKVKTMPLLSIIFGAQAAMLGTGIGAGLIAEKGLLGVGAAIIAAGLAGAGALIFGGTKLGNRAAKNMADRLTRAIAEQTQGNEVRDRLMQSVRSEKETETEQTEKA